MTSVRLYGLPLRSLLFLSESSLVGAGEDFEPAIYKKNHQTGHIHFLCLYSDLLALFFVVFAVYYNYYYYIIIRISAILTITQSLTY